MRGKDIELYIELLIMIIFSIVVGIYLWHVQMAAALNNCTKPCTILNSFWEATLFR